MLTSKRLGIERKPMWESGWTVKDGALRNLQVGAYPQLHGSHITPKCVAQQNVLHLSLLTVKDHFPPVHNVPSP